MMKVDAYIYIDAICTNQTFIRNAKAKALADSPALNEKSRASLVAATPEQLPPSVVSVPGPPMPPSRSTDPDPAAAAHTHAIPPLPPRNDTLSPSISGPVTHQSLLIDEGEEGGGAMEADGGGEVGSDEGEAEEALRPNADPYAGLDSAFGGALSGEPNSMGNGSTRHGGEDLLI